MTNLEAKHWEEEDMKNKKLIKSLQKDFADVSETCASMEIRYADLVGRYHSLLALYKDKKFTLCILENNVKEMRENAEEMCEKVEKFEEQRICLEEMTDYAKEMEDTVSTLEEQKTFLITRLHDVKMFCAQSLGSVTM